MSKHDTCSAVAATPPAPLPPPIVEEDFLHKDLLTLGSLDCRWPDGTGPYTFCGQTVPDFDMSYCEKHTRMSQKWPSTEG